MSARNVAIAFTLGRRDALAVWECDGCLSALINLILWIGEYAETKKLTW